MGKGRRLPYRGSTNAVNPCKVTEIKKCVVNSVHSCSGDHTWSIGRRE